MFKFDFNDFTAPLVGGEGYGPLGEVLSSAEFTLAVPQVIEAKVETSVSQALMNGDDYAGDASTTGVLEVGGQNHTFGIYQEQSSDTIRTYAEGMNVFYSQADDTVPGDISSTVPVLLDEINTVTFEFSLDQDWLTIYLNEGDYFHYGISNPYFDIISVLDATGDTVASSLTNSPGFLVEETGQYFISPFNIIRSGSVSFTPSVTRAEYAADATTRGTVLIDGTPTQSQLEEVGDVDWFAVTAEAGDAVRFAVTDQGFTNVQMRLVDAQGNNVEGFDFGNYGPNLDFIHEFVESGTYYLQVREAWDAWAGSYEITASLLNPDVSSPNFENSYIGSEYDDEIFVGTSSAQVSALAGDDYVVAVLGNAPSASFSGGAGTDTLDLTVSNYQRFDFRAAEFEIGIVRNTDGAVLGRYSQSGPRDFYTQYDVAGTKAWSRYVTVINTDASAQWSRKEYIYDDAGGLSETKTLNADGTFVREFTDTLDVRSYETRDITYISEGGDILEIDTLYDYGRRNLVTYDVDDAEGSWDLRSQTFDLNDTASWESVTTYYINLNGGLTRTRFVIERDDSYTSDEVYEVVGPDVGSSVRTLTDTASNQNWDSWVFTFNADRQTLESARTNDNGVITTLTYDRGGEFDWARRSVSEDTADIFNWTTSERLYNDAGQTMSLEIDYDDGLNVLNEYDLASEYAWARKVTRTETDGDITEYYYDDAGVLYDTIIL